MPLTEESSPSCSRSHPILKRDQLDDDPKESQTLINLPAVKSEPASVVD